LFEEVPNDVQEKRDQEIFVHLKL